MSILVLGVINHIEPELKELSSSYLISYCRDTDRSAFLDDLKNKHSSITGILTTVEGLHDINGMDADVIAKLPESVKFICHKGAGYDLIDVNALTKRGIQLSNTPKSVDQSTSDTAIYLMIGAMRNFNRLANELRRGTWWYKTPEAHEPQGKVLGIIGMGGIGRLVRDKALAIGVSRVIYHNRNRLPAELQGKADYVTFEELLKQSDIISLHAPLNEETEHMIDDKALKKCKDGVVIINTGRGKLINENSLAEALKSGKVSTVGLDSYEDEPHVHPELLKNENILLLPHIGTHTVETRRRMELAALNNLIKGIQQGKLKDLVPEQKDHFRGEKAND